jgi:ABC-type bacteriocin/lantibiotic exporter with double-glycine peptidase domain
MTLKTKSFKQSKMMCGPACLKIVADYYGIHKSERELSKLCKASKIDGTTGENMLKGARAVGLDGKIQDNANFELIAKWLRKGIPVIVDWFSPGQSRPVEKSRMADGHYSVVVGLTKTHILLEDPGLGQKRKVPRHEFMRVWFDFDTRYLARPAGIILRRIITIAPQALL